MLLQAEAGATRGAGSAAAAGDNRFQPAARGQRPRAAEPAQTGQAAQSAMAAAFAKLRPSR